MDFCCSWHRPQAHLSHIKTKKAVTRWSCAPITGRKSEHASIGRHFTARKNKCISRKHLLSIPTHCPACLPIDPSLDPTLLTCVQHIMLCKQGRGGHLSQRRWHIEISVFACNSMQGWQIIHLLPGPCTAKSKVIGCTHNGCTDKPTPGALEWCAPTQRTMP
jgi:hypothetical protein